MEIKEIVRKSLEEDINSGDKTTEKIIPKGIKVKAVIVAKEDCVICGLGVAEAVFKSLDDGVKFKCTVRDGDPVKKGHVIAEMEGEASAVLTGERTALNFLQRLSGIATKTRKMAERIRDTKARVLDTRKTTPGLRVLEKYAVMCGGGQNHRKGLYDEFLIKGNHIKLVGLRNAVLSAKETGKRVEVETKTLREVTDAVDSGADVIMLDNMPLGKMKKAVHAIGDKAIIEVSGGVNENNIGKIAKLGVDWISVGSLTHSVKSVDIGLYVEKI